MKKVIYVSICLALSIYDTILSSQKPFIPTSTRISQTVYQKIKPIQRSITENIPSIRTYGNTIKSAWNNYWKSITNPTNKELKEHSLWYGLKTGNTESYRRPSPHYPYYYQNDPYTSYIFPENNLTMNNSIFNRQSDEASETADILSDENIERLQRKLKELESQKPSVSQEQIVFDDPK
jgi:hypothetical protein